MTIRSISSTQNKTGKGNMDRKNQLSSRALPIIGGGGITPTNIKYGAFAVNLPPVVDTKKIYEFFFMDNGAVDPNAADSLFAKSFLIDRTKHKAWEAITNYTNQLASDKANGASYHYAYKSKSTYNLGGNEVTRKGAVLTDDDSQNYKSFTIAPIYKITLTGNPGDKVRTLNIDLYDSDVNSTTQILDNSGSILDRYPTHSYEQYTKEILQNHGYQYDRNPNNQNTLRIPHAVAVVNNVFLFNVGVFNSDPVKNCSIEISNCHVTYDPSKTYSMDSTVTGISDLILDLKRSNYTTISNAYISSNIDINFESFSQILNEPGCSYNKLIIKGMEPNEIITQTGFDDTVRIKLKNFNHTSTGAKAMPAEMRDIGYFLHNMGLWLDNAKDPTGAFLRNKYKLPGVVLSN